MKKALITLAIAAASISTLGAASAAQAGVSIVFSSHEPVIRHAPRVYYPAPVVVYPGEHRGRRHYHHHRVRNIDYRYGRQDRYENRRDCDRDHSRERDDEFDRDGYRRRH
jgi:hypothetical protein